MAGPPTPPPTSETELQDQARTDASTAPPPVPAPAPAPAPAPQVAQPRQTPQDVYHFILPKLADLAGQGDFNELIRVAELADLNSEDDRSQSRLLLTAPLVLAYLIVDDLPPARYALTRLPDSTASTPLAQTLFSLLASTWERKHAKVYSRAENLFHMVGRTDFPDGKLASVIATMAMAFVESFRQRTFVLLSKAYTSMPLLLAQTYLGLPADQLLAASEKNGWTYDAASQILNPNIPKSSSQTSVVAAAPSSLATFDLVAGSVMRLEF